MLKELKKQLGFIIIFIIGGVSIGEGLPPYLPPPPRLGYAYCRWLFEFQNTGNTEKAGTLGALVIEEETRSNPASDLHKTKIDFGGVNSILLKCTVFTCFLLL